MLASGYAPIISLQPGPQPPHHLAGEVPGRQGEAALGLGTMGLVSRLMRPDGGDSEVMIARRHHHYDRGCYFPPPQPGPLHPHQQVPPRRSPRPLKKSSISALPPKTASPIPTLQFGLSVTKRRKSC